MANRIHVLSCVTGVALAVAGCGGSGDETVENQSAPGAAAVSAPATPPTTAPAPRVDAVSGASNWEACLPSGVLQYLCGPTNAEDLVQIGDTRWLIASGMNGQIMGNDATGHIYLVDHLGKSYQEWFPGTNPAFARDTALFADCPGPIDTTNFSAHGLALQAQPDGNYRLYMTSHGARDAIEVFDVDISGAKPAIRWAGCVVLPATVWPNSVAILADGGFVTTRFSDPTDPNAFPLIRAGGISGEVWEWHPGGELTALAGTELSGANGILVSDDERWMYVAAFGGREVVRFDRHADPMAKTTVAVDILPDNLHWSAAGSIYTVGSDDVTTEECSDPPCEAGWSVYEINPDTMSAVRVTGVDHTATLQGPSVALPVGNEIWIGTYGGDRIGYLPKP